jgi:hypothetical protein
MMKQRIWGTVRFYDDDGDMVFERRYYTIEGRGLVLLEMESKKYSYYHILPFWEEKTKRMVTHDQPKPFKRPPARYDNRSYS